MWWGLDARRNGAAKERRMRLKALETKAHDVAEKETLIQVRVRRERSSATGGGAEARASSINNTKVGFGGPTANSKNRVPTSAR